jgi:hypothetical protein
VIVQHDQCIDAASDDSATNNIFKPTVSVAAVDNNNNNGGAYDLSEIDYHEVTSHYSFMDDFNDVDHAIVRARDHAAIVTTEDEGIGGLTTFAAANNNYDASQSANHHQPHDNDDGNLFDASLVESKVVVRPAAAVTTAGSNNNMLTNQVICGYQGWFGTPNDGAPINRWRHWFHAGSSVTYTNLTVDMYPTIDEYNSTDLAVSNITMPNGSYAKFFSSARLNVVVKHFEWMQTYGITGVFHHRFVKDLENVNVNTTRTIVLKNVRHAAKTTGRKFAVSYDLAGTDNSSSSSSRSTDVICFDRYHSTFFFMP